MLIKLGILGNDTTGNPELDGIWGPFLLWTHEEINHGDQLFRVSPILYNRTNKLKNVKRN